MKQLLTVALMALAPFSLAARNVDDARGRALHIAEDLVSVLEDIEEEAGALADEAQDNRDYADAKALGNLSHAAGQLSNKVDAQIVRAIHGDATFAYLRAQLSRLKTSIAQLDTAANEAGYLPWYLEDELVEAKYLLADLAVALKDDGRGRPGRPDREY